MKKYLRGIWFAGMISLTLSACNAGKKENLKEKKDEREFKLKDGNYKLVRLQRVSPVKHDLSLTHSENYMGLSVKWVSDDVFRFESLGKGEVRFHSHASGQLSCPGGRVFDTRLNSSGLQTDLVTKPSPYASNCKLGHLELLELSNEARKKYIKTTQIEITPKGFDVSFDLKGSYLLNFHNLQYGSRKQSKLFFELQP